MRLVAALAAALVACLSLTGAARARTAPRSPADRTIVVDDAQQGTGPGSFDYVGSDWGHASGEGAPANPFDGTNSWADHAGDTATFSFVGTKITLYAITAPQHGIAAVSVDGGASTSIDLYSAQRTGDVAVWTSPTLTEGPHTLTLAWTGQKNPASSGTTITADRVSYIGQPPPPVHTDVAIDGSDPGRTFDGIGAISGGGGNSRLLIDYPAKQRNAILDYLFKPGYGASLQVLKLEIGGDANSTDGAEPSVEHSRGAVNCNAGYEFWLAEQAKKRNPNIKLYGLAWAAPGWIDHGDFWSQATIRYLMTWMGCAHSHGLAIDYLGGWNERGHKADWYVALHKALLAHHDATKIVADDSGWSSADEFAKDPAFEKAVDILGAHYSCEGGDGGNADSCQSTQAAQDSGKPLWDSEQGSQDDQSGAGPLIRAITRGYIDARMTALLNWPLIAAITPNLPYPTTGLMVAPQPWSGHYAVGDNTWVTAQVTQFVKPGWRFLDGASGYLHGDRSNGSYVSLRSPSGHDFSTIVETTTATAAQTATFSIGGGLPRHAPVHVWATKVTGTGGPTFRDLGDVAVDAAGSFSHSLAPGYVYTFSTVDGAGHGTATSPRGHALALPYRDDFDSLHAGQEAPYLSDMQGAFEAQRCAAGRPGMCVTQMAPTRPIEWQPDSDAFTLLGDPSWRNYTVSSDVELARPGTVELIGRAGTQNRPQSAQAGYYLQLSDTGDWRLVKSDATGTRTTLARASVPRIGTGSWHRLALTFSGSTITASIDGTAVGVVRDASVRAGQVGLGIAAPRRASDPSQYVPDQFDNLSVVPAPRSAPAPTLSVRSRPASVSRGKDLDVTATFAVPLGVAPVRGLNLTLDLPEGFIAEDLTPQVYGVVRPGHRVSATWRLTAPTDTAGTMSIGALATFAQARVAHWQAGTGSTTVTNPPAPTGTVDVSTLPFLSATNGWGPVERDESVGGNGPDDGSPLSIGGTTYATGLGTNADSDIKLYLGGRCTSFRATVGIDDEVGDGSATFRVVGDGATLASTPTMTGADPGRSLSASVAGVQVLDLIVGDAGNGNGDDHGDWALPTLTCDSASSMHDAR